MKRQSRPGFYINLSEEDRQVLDELKERYAVNIAQAFRIFLRDMLKRLST